jgi:alginate O-acetyltransferase complex protein AlgJ
MHAFRIFPFLTALLPACFAAGIHADEAELFRQHCAALSQDAEKTNAMTVAGRDGFFFLAGELRHIGAGKFWGEAAPCASRAKADAADPLPAILDFNDQLKKIGVRLIIVPVPPKAVIYPDKLPACTNFPAGGLLDTFHQEFYAILRAKGVTVLDLTEYFLQNRNDPRGALYCRQDSHWSGSACVLAAQKIVEELKPLLKADKKSFYEEKWETIEISGDLWLALNNRELPREKLRVRKIVLPGTHESVAPDAEGKVILLGDSHNLVFHGGDDMLFQSAGLPDQLAFELGSPVDLVAVRGSGATPARINLLRHAQQNKNYWKNKKCVVWCFSAREFTESDGWRKVPIK